MIRHHHEQYDGTGYPYGLEGEEIPLGSRILAVIDAYVAIRDERIYSKAHSHEEAVAELRRASGTQFDPEVVAAFLQFIAAKLRKQPTPSEDRLNTQPSKILDKPAASATVST